MTSSSTKSAGQVLLRVYVRPGSMVNCAPHTYAGQAESPELVARDVGCTGCKGALVAWKIGCLECCLPGYCLHEVFVARPVGACGVGRTGGGGEFVAKGVCCSGQSCNLNQPAPAEVLR